MASDDSHLIARLDSHVLNGVLERNQVWPLMAAKYGVENPVPPWKSSLDGLCDALDHATCESAVPTVKERRDEEDELASSRYAQLPYPENQLVALAHSLLARGVITEEALRQQMAAVRTRLEA